MAVLTTEQRREIAAEIMQSASASRENLSLSKVQVLAAVAAADDWRDANAASYNSALPTAARNNLTAEQKAKLLNLVTRKALG